MLPPSGGAGVVFVVVVGRPTNPVAQPREQRRGVYRRLQRRPSDRAVRHRQHGLSVCALDRDDGICGQRAEPVCLGDAARRLGDDDRL